MVDRVDRADRDDPVRALLRGEQRRVGNDEVVVVAVAGGEEDGLAALGGLPLRVGVGARVDAVGRRPCCGRRSW